MAIYTDPPEWEEQGKKPPSSKRTEGWKPGDRVPASWLNWFWFSTVNSLREIAQAFVSHVDDKNNPHGVTVEQIGAAPLDAAVPIGGIIMWSGSIDSIPPGWALCDGRNGTPDLRDKFIVGAGLNYQVGEQGGAAQVTLTVEQLPPHSHQGTTSEAGAHTHTYSGSTDRATSGFGGSDALRYPATSRQTSESGMHSHTFTTETTGGGQPHENRPPYYALAYIMRVAVTN